MAATSKADHLRFLTLTLAHSNTPLADQVKRLYECFQRFRRRPEWKKHVRGGMAVLEVKISSKDGLWHPHLHVLLDGTYWHQTEIARIWREITGDSCIVDIRAVYSRTQAAGYVAKYGAKPPELETWSLFKIAEYAAAIHRRRMVLTFGTLHGVKIDADDEKERTYVDRAHVPIHALESRGLNGCPLAKCVLRALSMQSHAYRLTRTRREIDGVMVLGRPSESDVRRSRAAMLVLHRHWQRSPATFSLGGRARKIRTEPPAGPPRGKPKKSDTPPIADWREPARKHW